MNFFSSDISSFKLGLKQTTQDYASNAFQPTLHKIPPLYSFSLFSFSY